MNEGVHDSKQDPLSQLLDAIQTSGKVFRKRTLRFLLDTDRNVENETRIGLTPEHIRQLISALQQCGINLNVCVAQVAGIWAGYRDNDFRDAGAEIVNVDNLGTLEQFDVVHALKEPVDHEAQILKPFMRIGALHLAGRSDGVSHLLLAKKFSALFDGSTTGSCSYLLSGAEETPIVASMSQLAGIIASERVVKIGGERLQKERVLIVGAGYAGISAILGLRDRVGSLTVVEKNPDVRVRLSWLMRKLGFSEFAVVEKCTRELLAEAKGVIFAHRTGADPAEKICSIDDIREMEQGSVIIDIAIDQGGSIACREIMPDDEVSVRIRKYKEVLSNYCYYAESNMPRRKPREASKRHGDAVLPYIVALLILCAEHGDPAIATEYILKRNVQRFKERDQLPKEYERNFFECVVQDLRNGLELAVRDGKVEICDPDLKANKEIEDFVYPH
jgi:alanine dehydrogenase